MQTAISPNKSTNVRPSIVAIRLAFRTLGATVPDLAARAGGWLWTRPIRARMRQEQAHILDASSRGMVDAPDAPVRIYEWGPGEGPTALLVHGWGGHAGQMTPFVEPLRAMGFHVVAVDLPAHGESQRGTPNLITFGRTLQAVEAAIGNFQVIAAHSMGAGAATWAMEAHGLQAARAVFVAPAGDLQAASRRFARMVALGDAVRDRMQARFEERMGVAWTRLNVAAAAPKMRAELLVFHDEADRAVPFAEGAAVAEAWPGAELVRTTGLGHHRILGAREVLDRAVAFLAGGEEMEPREASI